ncbi:cytochrome P450, partial [Ceratobasidium sp. AG-I]
MSLDLDVLKGQVTLRNALIVGCGLAVFKLRHYLYWPIYSMRSPLRQLDGPEDGDFFLGHMIKIVNEQSNSTLFDGWIEKHGRTLRYRGFFGSYQLFTTDARAIRFILSHPTAFPKSEAARRAFATLLGDGLVAAAPEAHKRQRRIMNPAFGSPQIRDLVPVFWEKSNQVFCQLRDIWLELLDTNQSEGTTIDVLPWLTRATLDVIGSAGFGYEFNSLKDGDEDLLAKAFQKVFDLNKDITAYEVVKGMTLQAFGISTKERRDFDANLETIRRVGTKIVQDKKQLLQQDSKDSTSSAGRDLLTLLIKSNIDVETAGDNKDQTMSDNEVLG